MNARNACDRLQRRKSYYLSWLTFAFFREIILNGIDFCSQILFSLWAINYFFPLEFRNLFICLVDGDSALNLFNICTFIADKITKLRR